MHGAGVYLSGTELLTNFIQHYMQRPLLALSGQAYLAEGLL